MNFDKEALEEYEAESIMKDIGFTREQYNEILRINNEIERIRLEREKVRLEKLKLDKEYKNLRQKSS